MVFKCFLIFWEIVHDNLRSFMMRDMVKHDLRVSSYELRVESWKARVESLKARVEIQKCEFKSTSYEFESTSYEFETTSYEFESTRIVKSMKTQVNSLKRSSFSKIISPKLFGNSWGNLYFQFLVIVTDFSFISLMQNFVLFL